MPRRRDREHSSGPGAPGQRQLRVGEELRHLLAELLRPGELRDPALHDANITVTEVRLSPDLRNATAFVMPLGGANAEEVMAGLRPSAPLLKARPGRPLDLRPMPQIPPSFRQAVATPARASRLLARPARASDIPSHA